MSVSDRFKAHLKPSTVKRRGSYKLYNAIGKYGSEHFYYEILQSNIPIQQLDAMEIQYIQQYDSYRNGYNSTKGGDGRYFVKIGDDMVLRQLAEQGYSAIELAEMFHVHKETIYRTLHSIGFWYHVSQQDILSLAEDGLDNSEIARLLQCSDATVSRALNRANRRRHRVPVKCRSDFAFAELEQDYRNQMSIDDIVRKYNISKTTFYRIKSAQQWATRPQIRKKNINQGCVQ